MKKIILLAITFWLGFTFYNTCVGQAPTITSFTPTSGAVGTLITITGTNLNNSSAFTVGGVPAVKVSNSATSLVLLVMPGTTTGTVNVTTAGGTISGAVNFSVLPTPYPGPQQGSKLVGTGANGSATQGWSIAISGDGNTAIVGGFTDNSFAGAAWVYSRSGGVWTQQGSKLVGTGAIGIGAHQGISVSISADGNTAIVGGQADNSSAGAAWIFIRSGGIWTQQGSKLVVSGSTYLGTAVSLSADGNTAIVGEDDGVAGATWVFTRSGGVWTQQGGKLVGTGSIVSVVHGYSLALSADGNTAIVGGQGDNAAVGAAWIFIRSGGVWTQQGSKLVGTGSIGSAGQGNSVSLSADGNTAIVGGLGDNSSVGAAWIFTRSGGVWTQQGDKLVGTGSIGNASQGNSVSLSADGNTAIVGGSGDNGSIGALWVYTRSEGVWTQQGSKLVGTGGIGSSNQGWSASLSADGKTAITGGYNDNTGPGSAWVYGICTDTSTLVKQACSSYTLNSQTYASSGTYTQALISASGCDSIIILNLTVNELPTVTGTALADVCQNSGDITLSFGSPAGGTYSGTHVNSNIFTPSSVGTTTITYSYTDANGCTNTALEDITVNALPNVTASTMNNVCQNSGGIPLSFGSPAGGTYSGINVSNGVFTPSSIGSIIISYLYTDANGCENSASSEIIVAVCTGIDEAFSFSEIKCFPNPSNGKVTLEFEQKNQADLVIQITNMQGVVIIREEQKSFMGNYNNTFDLSLASKGIYFMELRSGSNISYQKIVVQ